MNPNPTQAAIQTVEQLRAYARRASIVLMRFSGGGSEMFERIGDEFYAEPERCEERFQHKQATIARIEAKRSAQSLSTTTGHPDLSDKPRGYVAGAMHAIEMAETYRLATGEATTTARERELEDALTKALTTVAVSLAFLGRDRGTGRQEKALDDIEAELVKTDATIRQVLATSSQQAQAAQQGGE